MRVLTVVVVASVLLVFVGDGHTAPDRSVALWQGFDLAALGVTLLVVLASVVAGLVLRIPAGQMISAIVIGTAWNWWSGAALENPAPLLGAASDRQCAV